MKYLNILFCSLVVLSDNFNTILGAGTNETAKSIAPIPRRRVMDDDVAIDQKDVLLDLLEAKLKELYESRKKKNEAEESKCANLPKNLELKLKSNGISAVGEADFSINHLASGKKAVNIESTGISNIGSAKLKILVDDDSINIPGLNNLCGGIFKKICTAAKGEKVDNNIVEPSRRKADNTTGDTKTTDPNVKLSEKGEEKANSDSKDKANNSNTVSPSSSSTVVEVENNNLDAAIGKLDDTTVASASVATV